ncbi:MAG TPA: sugar transferase, partial [Thermoanaerobaculia bacterium]|nr:sugar transferase [Thermoanaerobaculia bacterium]
MLKERARILAVGVFLLDLSLVSVAFLGAFWARNTVLPRVAAEAFPGRLHPLAGYLPLLPLALVIWGALLLFSGRYHSHRTVPLITEAWAILRVCVTGSILFTLFLYVARIDERFLGHDRVSRSWVLLFSLFAILLLLTEKLSLRLTSRYVRSHGLNYRTVLIVGTNPTALTIAESIDAHRFWGFRILGFIRTDDGLSDELVQEEMRHPVLGSIDDISRVIEGNVVDDVIFAVSRHDLDRLEDLFLGLQEQGIRTRFAIDLFPHARAQVQIEELDGMPLLSFATVPTSQLKLMFKRLLDVAMASLLLVLALPVVGLIALLIKVTSQGTVLFRQTRCGLNGRFFTLYKFRTMVEDAEDRRSEIIHLNEMTGPVFKLRADPRVTAFGRFLRRFSLDELPQLWNVLRGDMSLVGPRPEQPAFIEDFKRAIPRYALRHK